MSRREKVKFKDLPDHPWYVDHAMVSSNLGCGRRFFAAYTPYGVRQMEDGFRTVIALCETTTELVGVRAQIQEHPHFHPRIRRRLLAAVRDAKNAQSMVSERYDDYKDYRWNWWPKRLTEAGIRRLDGQFVNRILTCRTTDDAEVLKSDIEHNEHLHQEIKENLLFNLANRASQLVSLAEIEAMVRSR